MALLVLALALGAASAAQARVTLVATGTPELAFLGIPGNDVVARLALPGPARAVAVTRDGARGFVSAGSEVVAVDVNTRLETGRSAIGAGQPEIADIDLSRRGETLYVVRGAQLLVLDAQTLAQRGVIELRGEGRQLALANNGGAAAVTLRSGRVAMLSLGTGALLRRVKLKDATGVAIADNGLTYVTARGRLRVIARGQRRVRKKAIKLPAGAGGALTLSPGRSRVVAAAVSGGTSGAIVELRNARVQRIVAGRGPGRAAWYPDASRIVVADGGASAVSLISPFSRGRIGLVTLPGTAPSDLVVQPGLALMSGTEAADRITGTRGDDRIDGLGGDDLLRGGRGRDVLDGGPGNDTLSGGNNSDGIDGAEGNDVLTGGTGNDEMRGGAGADSLNGGTGNDSLQGEDDDDALDGGDGDDTITGGNGNDTIVEKGFGDDKLLDGGPGNDVIRGGRGSDQMILGGEGDDELYGETGSERILGGPGNDLIDGGRAGDRLEGDEGDDVIKGDAGNDHLYGRDGNDKLDAGSGTDNLFGEAGNDELVGGTGIDRFDGGPGDDVIRAADDSPDIVVCGDGNDTVYVEADAPTRDVLTGCETVIPIAAEPDNDTTAVITIRGTRNPDRLVGTAGDDSIFGRGGADRIYGMAGNDYVDGDANHDRLHGGDGDDLIAGRKGNDTIWGDAGNDRITGDRGRDRILGGAGNDTIYGNYDSDTIDGGTGNDRINVVHGGTDTVVCGRGKDVVFADPRDKIAKDCESVRR
ncbi:MAG: calcium-binding protein [Solirubrobacteraceae bacterium]|nr:calcium-binding protein [Solirubrobacteraceae bacterium]